MFTPPVTSRPILSRPVAALDGGGPAAQQTFDLFLDAQPIERLLDAARQIEKPHLRADQREALQVARKEVHIGTIHAVGREETLVLGFALAKIEDAAGRLVEDALQDE